MFRLADLPDVILAETLVELLRDAGISASAPTDRGASGAFRLSTTSVYLADVADVPAASRVLSQFSREVAALSGVLDSAEGTDVRPGSLRRGRPRHSA